MLAFAVFPVGLDAATLVRSPRLEKIALRLPDSRRMSDATVKLSDLAAGWEGGKVDPINSPPDCSRQNFSPFTITGQAEADYHDGVKLLISIANMFPSEVESMGDFLVGTQAGTAECEGEAFRRLLGPSARLISARRVAAPHVGQQAAAFEYVIRIGKQTFYSNEIQFVRGRALGALISINPGRPLVEPSTLARVMDERLRLGTA